MVQRWGLVERCTRYALKDTNSLEPMNATGAIIILSDEWIDVEELGILQGAVNPAFASQSGQVQNQPVPARSQASRPMAPVPERPNLDHSFEQGHHAGGQNDVEMEEAESQPPDAPIPQTVQQEAEQQQREPGIEIGVNLQHHALPDAGSEHVALQVVRDSIDVNGAHLTASSPVATLRGACKYLSLPSSGGKQKLFNQIIDDYDYDQQQLSLVQEVQASLGGSALARRSQPLVEKPSDEEVRDPQLTHIPYQPW